MAKTQAQFIFATFIISGVSLLLTVVGYGTNQWVVGNVDLDTSSDNRVTYGLFTGSYARTVSTQAIYGLTLTCDFGRNKCAMLCGSNALRSEYLQKLFDNDASDDGYRYCTSSTRSLSGSVMEEYVSAQLRADDVVLDGFINCGLWLTTVLFLGFSSLFGVISTVLAIWNTVANPVETFLSVLGLFAYNCVACTCSLIVLILWGVQFAVTLKDNIGIYDTISTYGDSSGNAALGYSYWLIFIAFLGYGASAVILAVRNYLINKEPDTIVNLEDKNDNTIILF